MLPPGVSYFPKVHQYGKLSQLTRMGIAQAKRLAYPHPENSGTDGSRALGKVGSLILDPQKSLCCPGTPRVAKSDLRSSLACSEQFMKGEAICERVSFLTLFLGFLILILYL